MYLLAGAVLASLGGGVATAVFVGWRVGDQAAVRRCLADIGYGYASSPAPADVRAAAACAADANAVQGWLQVLGMATLPAAAWILMIAGGLYARWRAGNGPAEQTPGPGPAAQTAGPGPAAHPTGPGAPTQSPIPGPAARSAAPDPPTHTAIARFEAWCDVLDLHGRRRPRLAFGPPGGAAFTTGLPFGRPLVVAPVSLAYADPRRFDVEILHELGHVWAGDASWAAALWWTGWLGGPALLLALAPFWTHPRALSFLFDRSLIVVALMSVALLVLRAWVLRRREMTADAFAVTVLGSPEPLKQALRHDRSRRPALFATHPAHAERADPGRSDTAHWDGGAAFSLAAGAVSIYLFQQLNAVMSNVWGSVAPWIPLAAATILWTAMVVPAWTRRATSRTGGRPLQRPRPEGHPLQGHPLQGHPPEGRPRTRQPFWVAPVVGAALGLPAGYALGLPGQGPAAWPSTPTGIDTQMILLAVAGAGVAALVTGMCSAAGASRARRAVLMLARLASSAVIFFTAVHTARMASMFVSLSDGIPAGSLLRASIFNAGAAATPGRHAAPLVLAASIVIVSASGAGWSAVRASAPFVVTVVPAAAVPAALSWAHRIGPTTGEAATYHLFAERMWICALAGLATTIAIALTARATPTALAGGLFTAAATGLLTLAVTAASGFDVTGDLVITNAVMPMWLALVASVVVMPVVLGLPAHRPCRWWAPAVAAGAAALAVIGGLLAPATIAPGDYEATALALERLQRQPATRTSISEPAPGPASDATGGDPGRPLDAATVDAALAAAAALLPREKQTSTPPRQTLPDVRPTACHHALRRSVQAEKALPRTVGATRAHHFPTPGAYGNVAVVIAVTSYRTPPPGPVSPTEVAACPTYSFADPLEDDGRVDCAQSTKAGTGRTVEVRATCTVDQQSQRHRMASRFVETVVGHNRITALVVYNHLEPEPPQSLSTTLDDIPNSAVAAVLAGL